MENTLNKRERHYTINTFFYSFIVMGAFFSVIGAALPMMREEYMLDYQISGMMMSALSTGYLIAGATVDVIARYLGSKRTYLVFNCFLIIGLSVMMLTSDQTALLAAAALAGLSRGCIDTYGNRAVSVAAQGNDMSINLLQACYSTGTCISPLITMVCGASWRTAFIIVIAFSVGSVILGFRLKFEEKKENTGAGRGKMELGFFRSRLFWQCTIFLTCYISIEDTLIGWTVTYFTDSGLVSANTAQMMASLLYAMIMVGRLVSSWLSCKFKADHLLIVMTAGVALWFSVMVFSRSLVFMIAGLTGLGLFMAGIYGASLANSSELIEKYPMCMGMFITIPGIGAVFFPGLTGIVANHIGIHSGLRVLYSVIIVMCVNAVVNLKKKKRNKKKERRFGC